MARLLRYWTNRERGIGGIVGRAEICGAEVTIMVTGEEWLSRWSGWDEAEALLAIAAALAEQCDASALDRLDSVTISSWGAHGLDAGGRWLFTDLPVKPAN